ncbi:MAG: 50S ribosomal protein L11 methyltransferase [Nevskiales bacterium]|nr:50S ribosomal protein L11 methyltransferase [Nevskiales bacterium]
MPWIQLKVPTRHPEFAEEVLFAHGAVSVIWRDAADAPVLEPPPGATPLWPETETLGLFPAAHSLTPVAEALRRDLPDGAALHLTTEILEDQDWVRVWLRDCPPLKFGERLWVCPRERTVYEPGTVTVRLDPGLAFGTGTHPSTALCLDWLARGTLQNKTVLDYGCGSGLLAIAALKLGAAWATAVDVDPQALIATRENAAENGVADRLRVQGTADFTPRAHDVVLANILAGPLVELAPRLSGCLAPGGRLVLAGLLSSQAGEVQDAYAPWILFGPPLEREGWIRIDGQRKS